MVFVGFSTPRRWNPLSALIRRMMKSNVSHVWLLVEDPIFKLRLVMEAHTTGFRLISLTRFVKDNKVVALIQPGHALDEGLPEAGGWLGDDYDVLGLFGIFLATVKTWLTRKRARKNLFTSTRALFCSEAVVRAMKAAKYPGAETFGDETTNPAELLAFFGAEAGARFIGGEELKLWTDLRKQGLKKAKRQRAGPEKAALPAT